MNRRGFVLQVALAAAGLSACSPLNSAASRGPRAAQTPARKKVIIAGAGLAGLAAGYELQQAGHHVAIVEARDRPGGRVHTIREPFSDGLHAEAGAIFVPDNHRLTLRYADVFNLAIEPSTPLFATMLFYVRGQRLVASASGNVEWPFDLTAEERKLGLVGMWEKYISPAVGSLGDVAAPGWPSDQRLKALDRMSAAEFLKSRGASSGAVALLRVGYLDHIGDGIDSYSALLMLHHLAVRQTERQRFMIKGGTDLLPKAFAEKLADRIQYESAVIRIEPGERSVSVVIKRGGEYQRLTADRVVCAIPFSVLKTIEISPPFSPQKMQVIDQLPYTSIAQVYLQFKRKRWTSENFFVAASTDMPIKWVLEHTVNQGGPGGILEAQAAGANGRRLTAMSEGDRIAFALSQLGQIFPGIGQDFERGASKCWDEDPWARGAFPYFRPGQVLSLLPHIATREGRVHFAGEHTSPWSGWMQGALESGLRAAREIDQAA